MFLLLSGRHVGANPYGHQHDVSIQSSINLGKTFRLLIRSVLVGVTLKTRQHVSLSVSDHTQRSQPSALFRSVFIVFCSHSVQNTCGHQNRASQIFLVALLAYVQRWCAFCLTTFMKQFVDSEGRVFPVDLKIDN